MGELIGQSIGRYHILEQLGEGGMAVVYKAYDTRLERDVAVKVIRVDQFPPAALERILKRFEREAKSLAKLSHLHIIKVIDYGEHEGAPYLIMEYMPGGTLKEKLGRQIPWAEAAGLLLPVARALAYAHREGVIHRDVKPNNILMTRSGDPMLTDFGIAKILDISDSQALTGSGVGIGTPEYMAPEQALGQEINARADVYALGVVFYEMVTGKKPFIADTPLAVILKHINNPLPRPSSYVPDLPEAVEHVLIKALAKKPKNRYASMDDLAAALEGLSTGQVYAMNAALKGSVVNDQTVDTQLGHAFLEQAEREAAEKAAREQAEREAAEKAAREQAEREATEKAAREQAEREAIEKTTREQAERKAAEKIAREQAEREAADKAAREQAEREAAEKIAREQAEREAAEKAVREQAKREAAEKTAREQAERETAEKAAREQAERDNSLTTTWQQPAPQKRTLPAWVKYASVIIVLLAVLLGWLWRNSAAQLIPTNTPTLTSTPLASDTPKLSSTPMVTATPTLGIGSTLVSEGDGMLMVYVPEGPFTMGSNDGQNDEKPVHTVSLDAFWIDQTEVTNAMYALCIKSKICRDTGSKLLSDSAFARVPVVDVSWNEAKAYCEWAGRRLPTEAEWEKAASGTEDRIYPWGNDNPSCTLANYSGCSGKADPVGSHPTGASPYGALDMAGNVWEWVADWYDAAYYQGSPSSNPPGPTSGDSRVLRGGSWSSNGNYLRVSYRWYFPDTRDYGYGFRCALSAPESQPTPESATTPTPASLTNVITDAKGAKMALIPAGTFSMGSATGEDNEKPVHSVTLNAFYMDVYEVTNALYKACVEAGACKLPKNTDHYNNVQYVDHPVVYVDWNMAKTYCEWRNARLPTEAEWEYAARGTDGRTYPWGEGIDKTFANYNNAVGDTTPVGSYEKGKSFFGIYDMAGNVNELVSSRFMPYPYNADDGRENLCDFSTGCVLRGGSWVNFVDDVRSARRLEAPSWYPSKMYGFRCSRTP